MLTRTAFIALSRIAKGQSAFRTMIPSTRGYNRIQENRREAISELYRLRYVKRGACGPEITSTGRAALEFHNCVISNPWPKDRPTVGALAERYGVHPEAMKSRVHALRYGRST